MSKFFKIFGYNVKMTLRQREALFWLFLFPVLLMVILGFVFGSSGEVKLKVGIVDLDGSLQSQIVMGAFTGDDPRIKEGLVVETGSEEEERAAIKDGDRNAVVIIPEGFGEKVAAGEQAEVTIIVNQSEVSTAQITTATLNGILSSLSGVLYNLDEAMSGSLQMIAVNEEAAQDVKDFEYIDFMVPGILAMVLMFGGLAGYSLEIASYREKGILRRIKVSPLSLATYLSSGILSVLIFTLVQSVLLLLVGVFAFNLHINGSYLYIFVLVIIGALSFLALGFLIASLTKNMRSAGLASQAIAMPMMFLSGIFFSVEWVPAPLKVIAQCLPLYYLGDALRQVMIDSASLMDVWVDILVLVAMGIIALLASIKFFRWE
ncbi:MAG: ABC transporter permease [Actinomycetota bacterium]